MSEITQIFFNIFWQNKACQNLFLLSKEELLDTKEISFDGNTTSVSFPRIIISNVNSSEYTHDKIKLRTETDKIKRENLISDKINLYTPIISEFLEKKFGKSINKLVKDLEKKPQKFIWKVLEIIFTEGENIEEVIIEFLQNYGFIGKHINSFEELETNVRQKFLSKNFKSFLSEKNIWNILEFIKSIKDIYVNEYYSSLYGTNQILVNALHSSDDYISRLQLFSLLFDNGIISFSNEDAVVECSNCPAGTYKGVLQLNISPENLKNITCPVCNNEATYYIPYKLHNDIYDLIKQPDGLLFGALKDYLDKNEIVYKTNKNYLNDIEIDCLIETNLGYKIIETKMYKLNTTRKKINSKLKEHYGKLIKDTRRLIKESPKFKRKKIKSYLLTNIIDNNLIAEMNKELRKNNLNLPFEISIININDIEKLA